MSYGVQDTNGLESLSRLACHCRLMEVKSYPLRRRKWLLCHLGSSLDLVSLECSPYFSGKVCRHPIIRLAFEMWEQSCYTMPDDIFESPMFLLLKGEKASLGITCRQSQNVCCITIFVIIYLHEVSDPKNSPVIGRYLMIKLLTRYITINWIFWSSLTLYVSSFILLVISQYWKKLFKSFEKVVNADIKLQSRMFLCFRQSYLSHWNSYNWQVSFI